MASPTALPPETAALIATLEASSPPQLYATYDAPDGQWRAAVTIHACGPVGEARKAYEVLKMIQVANGAQHIVDQQVQSCGGLGAYGLAGLFWSANSRYFYYTDARTGVPDGCGFWAQPLRRFDTLTRQTNVLGNGSHSPDAQKIVTWAATEWQIWDADGAKVMRQPLLIPNAQLGSYAWSPDSQALVYVQVTTSCPPTGPAALVRIDLTTQQQTLLVTAESTALHGITWEHPEQLHLLDDKNQEWLFMFDKNMLVPKN